MRHTPHRRRSMHWTSPPDVPGRTIAPFTHAVSDTEEAEFVGVDIRQDELGIPIASSASCTGESQRRSLPWSVDRAVIIERADTAAQIVRSQQNLGWTGEARLGAYSRQRDSPDKDASVLTPRARACDRFARAGRRRQLGGARRQSRRAQSLVSSSTSSSACRTASRCFGGRRERGPSTSRRLSMVRS